MAALHISFIDFSAIYSFEINSLFHDTLLANAKQRVTVLTNEMHFGILPPFSRHMLISWAGHPAEKLPTVRDKVATRDQAPVPIEIEGSD